MVMMLRVGYPINMRLILARGMILYLFSEQSTPVVRPLQTLPPPHSLGKAAGT